MIERLLGLLLRRRCWCGRRTPGLDPYCSGRCARVDRDHPNA